MRRIGVGGEIMFEGDDSVGVGTNGIINEGETGAKKALLERFEQRQMRLVLMQLLG